MQIEKLRPVIKFLKGHVKIISATSLGVFLLIITFANLHNKMLSSSRAVIAQPKRPSVAPTPTIQWKTYENELRGYKVQVPSQWESKEIIGRAIFNATEEARRIGSMSETSITVVTKPQSNQPLTTDKEFTSWLQKDAKKEIPEKGRLYKLDNVKVAGQEAVILVDLGKIGAQNTEDWSLVTWFRKDKDNYYINAKGHKKMTTTDTNAFTYFLGSFQFYQPKK